MSEHIHDSHAHHSHHQHDYDNCCDNHTPDNHGCGSCSEMHFNEHKKENITKIAISCVFFIIGYVISEFTQLPSYVYLVCYIISYLMVGFSIVRDAIEGVINGRIFDENFLMTIASIGAFAIKEYTEGVAVMLLFTIGEFIQGLTVSKSRESIDSIFTEKHETYTLPQHYDNEKSRTEEMITRFARVYTPAICVISLAIVLVPVLFFKAEWHQWLHRGLAALVVGCPCAIVISVPLCYSAGIGSCSRNSVFVKNTSTIDDICRCDEVITSEDNKTVDDIKVLQSSGKSVAYLGKGIGDLDMLQKADIAVAVGEDCTSDSVDLADIVVVRFNSDSINDTRKIAKKVRKIAMENIYFSIMVKLVILVLDVILAKELPMWFAIFGDIGVCLLAIANSARAISIKKK